MKLIKLSEEHYIIVDESEIKEGDWYYHLIRKTIHTTSEKADYFINNTKYNDFKKITHSTIPKGMVLMEGLKRLSLKEVKELLGYVDVEKKAAQNTDTYQKELGYIKGYKQALEDNKEKKYTEEDLRKAINMVRRNWNDEIVNEDKIIQSLSKTSWEVEFIDGKLKLK